MARSRRYEGDVEHQGDEHLADGSRGGSRPRPPVYGSGRPAFSPPTVLRGRGQDLPCTSAGGTPHPEFESAEAWRATNMPHARVLDGQSRSLTGTDPAAYLVRYCCSSHGRPRDRSSKLVMPATCQNGAETRDIGRYLDNEETGAHQHRSRWREHVKRPSKPDRRGGGRAALRIRRGAAGCWLARVAAARWRGLRPGSP